jgi:hypothetical protein
MNSNGAGSARLQLLPGVHLVAFDQQTLGAIARYREHIAYHLPNCTDQPGHIHSLAAIAGQKCYEINKNCSIRATKWLRASIKRQFYVAESFQVFCSKNRLIDRCQISAELFLIALKGP